MSTPAEMYDAIADEVSTVLVGQDDLVEHLTISLLTEGHILLEGVPGVAKTTLANVFAKASGLEYNRIQMTPDILPADITGTNVYQQSTGEFSLRRGPVFSNIVVADEINRATPKTQSALLEAMEEKHVSIEGETLSLPEPFMVIATQNPLEMDGTFELPEAQRDRFQLKLTVSIPDRHDEQAILDRFDDAPALGPADVQQVVETSQLLDAREHVEDIHVEETIRDYILDVVEGTRSHSDVEHGASPRASLAFLHTSKARAAIHGREYVIPDDVKALAEPILVHRLVLNTDAQLGNVSARAVVTDVLETVTPPSAAADQEASLSADGRGKPAGADPEETDDD
jgi:MoxR-like ATPase